jgi:hypothetical protein
MTIDFPMDEKRSGGRGISKRRELRAARRGGANAKNNEEKSSQEVEMSEIKKEKVVNSVA